MSLIRQRQTIDGQRIFGIVLTILGAAGVLVGLLMIFSEEFRPISLLTLGIWTLFCGNGVRQLVKARRQRIAFEEIHGPGAGKQEPIT